MKTITLEKLVLTNYRNIPFASYEFKGNSKIVGENKVGKTNTLEAIYYLLTDKLIDGSVDIAQLKPLTNTKEKVTVEGTFDVDGNKVTLKKVYYEQWVKTRGEATTVFKGHSTDYYYNDAKQDTKKAYETLVEELFGVSNDPRVKIDFMQMLINPTYLGEMGEDKDWTSLREFIIKLVGDISDDDVFAKEPKTEPIKSDLDAYSGKTEQVKKLYKSQISGIKDKITGYEVMIGNLEKTPCPEESEIEICKNAIEESENKIARLRNSKGIDLKSQEIQSKINAKEKEKNELVAADLERKNQPNPTIDNLNKEIDELKTKSDGLIESKHKLQMEISELNQKKSNLEYQINQCNSARDDVIKNYKETKERMNNIHVATECPVCHRPYDQEHIEEIKAEEMSRLKRELDEITEKGTLNKGALITLNKNKADIEEQIKTAESGIDGLTTEIQSISSKLNDKRSELHDANVDANKGFTPNPAIAKLEEEISELKKDLLKSQCEFDDGNRDVANDISLEQSRQATWKKVLDDKAYYDRQMVNLEQTRESLKNVQKELIAYEQKSDLLALFIKTKLNLLDENVSKVFGNIKFKLIEPNINGGYDVVCKPYIYNVDKNESTTVTWKSGSKSEKVVTGIAIVEAIKETLHLPDLPYLFDEGGEISSETFSTRFKTKAQLICVKVQDNIPNPTVMAI